MKLLEVTNQRPHKVYVDLDGVLVDFSKLAASLVPGWVDENHPERNKKLDKQLWKLVRSRARNGQQFWGDMDPLPDAMQLWHYVKQYNPEILSATGHQGNPIPEKHEWVARHLGASTKVNLVQRAIEKAQFAEPGAILIDDKNKALDPWVAAGGIGVHHTDAASTIAKLKKLGL